MYLFQPMKYTLWLIGPIGKNEVIRAFYACDRFIRAAKIVKKGILYQLI
jgi:hypothetical protein